MELKTQAIWLKGYLESLSQSDSISKKQVQTLMEKMGQLIKSIEENDDDFDSDSDSVDYNRPSISQENHKTGNSTMVNTPEDDLPF